MGLTTGGQFSKVLAQHGVVIRQAGVESPEQIRRVERHGGLWKAIMKRVVADHAISGIADMKIAAAECTSSKNSMSRNGGFSPSQWIFGTLPRGPGDQLDEEEFADLGALTGQLDSGTHFARRSEFRASARRAFVREDCRRRVARAVLRKAAPLAGNYGVGDPLCATEGTILVGPPLPVSLDSMEARRCGSFTEESQCASRSTGYAQLPPPKR